MLIYFLLIALIIQILLVFIKFFYNNDMKKAIINKNKVNDILNIYIEEDEIDGNNDNSSELNTKSFKETNDSSVFCYESNGKELRLGFKSVLEYKVNNIYIDSCIPYVPNAFTFTDKGDFNITSDVCMNGKITLLNDNFFHCECPVNYIKGYFTNYFPEIPRCIEEKNKHFYLNFVSETNLNLFNSTSRYLHFDYDYLF
ncbi:hypothetical protein LbFV_ORF55 [Leptopilina boulardi filamentous virus]|uniref:Uncharacterized protein n=1 Tax=Leptopilina boulardi filamentous virus TaxID=552509 RepID=A0A1S5YDA5_9VIRU|nr:hypothetical protein LbFV_ORF55 [Leptopilina boulardi filamentous virus]AQQ79975.1 hypothetical protein LbFV_ORF55 [Leptopilina boulardi filamentous virus]